MKFMLMMHVPAAAPQGAGIQAWSQDDVKAHMGFMHALNTDLKSSGEFIDAQGLDFPPRPRIVRAQGNGTPLVTDGPFVETKELLVGFWIVECATPERAVAIAARASSAPGPGGSALNMPIEVREVVAAPAV